MAVDNGLRDAKEENRIGLGRSCFGVSMKTDVDMTSAVGKFVVADRSRCFGDTLVHTRNYMLIDPVTVERMCRQGPP